MIQFVFFLVLFCIPAARGFCDTARLQVCNTGSTNVSATLAYAPIPGLLHKDYWIVSGWYVIKPGDCEMLGPAYRYNGQIYRNMYLGFAYWDAAGRMVPFRADSSKATNPGIIFTNDASNKFKAESNTTVCVEPRNSFEYQADDGLLMSKCGTTGVLFPLTLQFDPGSADVEDNFLFKLPVNVATGVAAAESITSVSNNQGASAEPNLAQLALGALLLGGVAAALNNHVPHAFAAGTLNAKLTGVSTVRFAQSGAQWYGTNGQPLHGFFGSGPDNLFDPPKQLATTDARVEAALAKLQQDLKTAAWGPYECSMSDVGRLTITGNLNEGHTSGDRQIYDKLIVISTLDLRKAAWTGRSLSIPCLDGKPCVYEFDFQHVADQEPSSINLAGTSLTFGLDTQHSANAVNADLWSLQQLYPARPQITSR